MYVHVSLQVVKCKLAGIPPAKVIFLYVTLSHKLINYCFRGSGQTVHLSVWSNILILMNSI